MKNLRERVKKEKKSTENTERNGNTRKSYTLFFNAHKNPQKIFSTRLVKQKRSGIAPFRFKHECGEGVLRLCLQFGHDDHFVSTSSIIGAGIR